jgi:hypothetical protein
VRLPFGSRAYGQLEKYNIPANAPSVWLPAIARQEGAFSNPSSGREVYSAPRPCQARCRPVEPALRAIDSNALSKPGGFLGTVFPRRGRTAGARGQSPSAAVRRPVVARNEDRDRGFLCQFAAKIGSESGDGTRNPGTGQANCKAGANPRRQNRLRRLVSPQKLPGTAARLAAPRAVGPGDGNRSPISGVIPRAPFVTRETTCQS